MPKHPLKRPAGRNIRNSAVLALRKARLTKILTSGKVTKNGVEKPISEVEIEKYGFLLERCENELSSIRPRTVKAYCTYCGQPFDGIVGDLERLCPDCRED